MGIQQVSFTGAEPKRRSFLKDVGASVANVGATVGVGATMGAAAGKIASLVPYKVKDADIAFQYGDMFLRAANNETMPEMFKGASEGIKNFIKDGRNCHVAQQGYLDQADEVAGLLQGVLKMSDDAIKGKEVQETIAKVFADGADKIPAGGYTKQMVHDRAKETIEHASDVFRGYGEYLDELKGKFVDAARAAGNSNWDEIAEKGAKALRNKSVIGAGIAIGVVTALAINIIKTFKNTARVAAQTKNEHQG